MKSPKKLEKMYICCDSGDLFSHIHLSAEKEGLTIIKNPDNTRTVTTNDGQELVFVFDKTSHKHLYDKFATPTLLLTSGKPDYIITNEYGTPLGVIEDSHTAPVGNAVLQRLDKLWPLWVSPKVVCPVLFIAPRTGIDVSMKQTRSWEQSWFFDAFVKHHPESILLLPPETDILDTVWNSILSFGHSDSPPPKKPNKIDAIRIIDSAEKNVRTYKNGVFRGTLFKPAGTDAHPVQSTLMLLSMCLDIAHQQSIDIEFRSDDHERKFEKSSAKRLCTVKNIIKKNRRKK